MSEMTATPEQILTWVTTLLGPDPSTQEYAGMLAIARNMLGQVSIWEGWTTPEPQLVFLSEPNGRLFYRPGWWVGVLAEHAARASAAAQPPDVREGEA